MIDWNAVLAYAGGAYLVCSGTALVATGAAKMFPKVTWLPKVASVFGTVALDIQKLTGDKSQ